MIPAAFVAVPARIAMVVAIVFGIHTAQLLTYMKLSGIAAGLLINFNVRRLIDGIDRFKF